MGTKRHKLSRGLPTIPLSVNISQLERDYEDSEVEFEISDDGLEQKRLEDSLEYEELVVYILHNLDQREKTVFAFQLLRDEGFQIDHGSLARAINLSRSQYIKILNDVRIKSALLMIGYRQIAHKEP